MLNTAPSRADPVVVFPVGRWFIFPGFPDPVGTLIKNNFSEIWIKKQQKNI